jgi:hypothetical protein
MAYKPLKFLTINTGSAELKVEKHEIENPEPATVKVKILTALNEMGKSAHVLLSYDGKLYTCTHTAARGPSKDYFRTPVRYHPYASQLT